MFLGDIVPTASQRLRPKGRIGVDASDAKGGGDHTAGPLPLYYKAIGDVLPRGFGRPDDADYLAPREAVVARDGVLQLHARELCFLHAVLLQKDHLLLFGEELVVRHQHMLRDVHQQLRLQEPLHAPATRHIVDFGKCLFSREVRHHLLHDDDAPLHLVLLHFLMVPLDGLHADPRIARPEHEYLVGRVVPLLDQDREPISVRLPRELLGEDFLLLVDIGLVDHVPSVAEHLVHRPPHAVHTLCHRSGCCAKKLLSLLRSRRLSKGSTTRAQRFDPAGAPRTCSLSA
mmetsp:Transcript_25325/g.38126  ORF Transcript_25325/g.38126 Transcript_25325/m.38126 type:complete len:287 (+) Transcript_25325:298-1158(+)